MSREFARPGVDPLWLKSWKKDCKNLEVWREALLPDQRASLERYVQTGAIDDKVRPFDPTRRYWSLGTIEHPLNIMSLAYLFELEKLGMSGVAFDSSLALRAVAANQIVSWIEAWRRRDSAPSPPRARDVAFTALGVIIGCLEESLPLARCQITMFKRGLYATPFPLFDFILRILGDYMGEAPLQLQGRSQQDPIFNGLFDVWRDRTPAVIEPLCLAACDYHTRVCATPSEGRPRNEFQQRDFTRLPVAILLLFKLRTLLGFENPKLDHPLMNSPLGVLPPEVKFESLATFEDNLVYRVRHRMQGDGYDEKVLFEGIYKT